MTKYCLIKLGLLKVLLLRIAIWIVNHLLPFTQRYVVKAKVTFCLTNDIGIVRHDMIANMLGNGRELFAFSRIPNFAYDAGKNYLFKTYDASYEHEADFVFGDIIKLEIDIMEIRGASFRFRGRFINKENGQTYVTAFQTIVYTNIKGMPTRFPSWLKTRLVLICRQNCTEENVSASDKLEGYEVFQHQTVVTSDMVNAEKNVSHDVYAKMLTQIIELYFMDRISSRACIFKVMEGSYKYRRDFYFGDTISIKLHAIEINSKMAVFGAEFHNADGKVHISGRQKIIFIDDKRMPKSIPEGLVNTIKTV